MRIIPTVFVKDKEELKVRLERLIKIAKKLQIDFMDGEFVKSKGIKVSDLPNLKKYKTGFEAHLMVGNPERYIKELKNLGFAKVIFHIEIKGKIERVIELIRKQGMKVWIAINPGTNTSKLLRYLDRIDGVLFMGVNPGKEKQKFIPSVYGKIREFKKANKEIKIQVDGGVTPEVIMKLKNLGVSYANSGSFISNAEKPVRALRKLKESFK